MSTLPSDNIFSIVKRHYDDRICNVLSYTEEILHGICSTDIDRCCYESTISLGYKLNECSYNGTTSIDIECQYPPEIPYKHETTDGNILLVFIITCLIIALGIILFMFLKLLYRKRNRRHYTVLGNDLPSKPEKMFNLTDEISF